MADERIENLKMAAEMNMARSACMLIGHVVGLLLGLGAYWTGRKGWFVIGVAIIVFLVIKGVHDALVIVDIESHR